MRRLIATRRFALALLAVVLTGFVLGRSPEPLAAQSAPAGVVLCQRPYYGGNCQAFITDVPNLTGSYVGNDATSSIRVAPGWAVSVWAEFNYSTRDGGHCQTFTSDVPDLQGSAVGNYAVSSLRLNVSCDGSPVGGNQGGTQFGRPNPPPVPLQPAPPPPPPSNFGIVANGGATISVSWVVQGGTVALYSPYTCACYIDVPYSTSYTFRNLSYGTWYCFIAYAYNQNGYSSWTPWACDFAH